MKRNFTIPLLLLLGAVSMATAGLNQIPLYLRSGLDSALLATGGNSCTTKWYTTSHSQVMAIAFQMREAIGHTDAVKPVIGVQYGLNDTIKYEKTWFTPSFDRSATTSVAPAGDTLLVGYGPYAFVLPPCAWVRFRLGTTASYADNVIIKQPWVYTYDAPWTGFKSATSSFSDSSRVAWNAYRIEGKDTTWIKAQSGAGAPWDSAGNAGTLGPVGGNWTITQVRTGSHDTALAVFGRQTFIDSSRVTWRADTARIAALADSSNKTHRARVSAQADSANRAHVATIADSAGKAAYADSCDKAHHAMIADSVPHPVYATACTNAVLHADTIPTTGRSGASLRGLRVTAGGTSPDTSDLLGSGLSVRLGPATAKIDTGIVLTPSGSSRESLVGTPHTFKLHSDNITIPVLNLTNTMNCSLQYYQGSLSIAGGASTGIPNAQFEIRTPGVSGNLTIILPTGIAVYGATQKNVILDTGKLIIVGPATSCTLSSRELLLHGMIQANRIRLGDSTQADSSVMSKKYIDAHAGISAATAGGIAHDSMTRCSTGAVAQATALSLPLHGKADNAAQLQTLDTTGVHGRDTVGLGAQIQPSWRADTNKASAHTWGLGNYPLSNGAPGDGNLLRFSATAGNTWVPTAVSIPAANDSAGIAGSAWQLKNSGQKVNASTDTLLADSLTVRATNITGTATAGTFSGAGTSLTGTAAGLSIGGNAATATVINGDVALDSFTVLRIHGGESPSRKFRASASVLANGIGTISITLTTAVPDSYKECSATLFLDSVSTEQTYFRCTLAVGYTATINPAIPVGGDIRYVGLVPGQAVITSDATQDGLGWAPTRGGWLMVSVASGRSIIVNIHYHNVDVSTRQLAIKGHVSFEFRSTRGG